MVAESTWDWVISGGILIWLGLIVGAKMTGQSVPDLMKGIKEFITDTKDDVQEEAEELLYYD